MIASHHSCALKTAPKKIFFRSLTQPGVCKQTIRSVYKCRIQQTGFAFLWRSVGHSENRDFHPYENNLFRVCVCVLILFLSQLLSQKSRINLKKVFKGKMDTRSSEHKVTFCFNQIYYNLCSAIALCTRGFY